MTVDASKIHDASRTFRAVFMREMGQAPRPFENYCRIIPAKVKRIDIKWLARSAGVHEWLDERILGRAKAFEWHAQARKWANGLVVDGEDLEDDNLMVYGDQIADLADDFISHKMDLVFELVANGFDASKGLAYDGQYFFDSDHQDMPDGPSQSNVGTKALAEASFYEYRAKMRKIRKPNGKYAGLNPNKIVIPTTLEATADVLFRQRERSGGGDNPLYNAVEPVVEPRLDEVSTTAWFLVDDTKPLKPLLCHDRRDVTFRAQDQANADAVFDRDEYRYGADARYEFKYYFWQTMHGSDGTT